MESIKKLRLLACDNRERIIRMIYLARAGHPGGSLSVIDFLTAIYELDVDLVAAERSRVVLSKGHAVPAQYAVLHEKGFIPEEELGSFRAVDSRLQGHPHVLDLPQVDATTGLLGQGLSLAVGMALAKKRRGDAHRVWAVVGDGELHEGQIWEGAMEGPQFGLDNLIFLVDYNKLSSSGAVNGVVNLEPLGDKLRAFGWDVYELNGNDMAAVAAMVEKAVAGTGKPIAVISHTTKGKGVSYMENDPKWHSSALTEQEYEAALRDINAEREAIGHG